MPYGFNRKIYEFEKALDNKNLELKGGWEFIFGDNFLGVYKNFERNYGRKWRKLGGWNLKIIKLNFGWKCIFEKEFPWQWI